MTERASQEALDQADAAQREIEWWKRRALEAEEGVADARREVGDADLMLREQELATAVDLLRRAMMQTTWDNLTAEIQTFIEAIDPPPGRVAVDRDGLVTRLTDQLREATMAEAACGRELAAASARGAVEPRIAEERLHYRVLLRHAGDRLYESQARDPGDAGLRELLEEIEEALR